ncbi:MAG: RluA family pseudouridine synthase [Bdellovibrionales bacterium]|nr:RluA family pseudouridine synthase [Bdellovibrionales bacterium]
MSSESPHYERIFSAFSSTFHRFEFLTEHECPTDLISALVQKLPHIEAEKWPKLLAWGGAYVNGNAASSNQKLSCPCRIEYYEPRYDIESPEQTFASFQKEHIIFEDEWLLAVYKPARLPCMPARDQAQVSLRRQLDQYCGAPVHMPSRLDMSTSGLVLVSKHPATHAELQRIFEQRRIVKIYRLAAEGSPDWNEQTVEAAIGKDVRHPVLRAVVGHGGKSAETKFRLLRKLYLHDLRGEQFEAAMVEAAPLTGRTHQIRVHSSYAGFPIVGDKFYGGREADYLHLLSFSLSFKHPKSGAQLVLELPEKYVPDWAKVSS